MRSTFIQKQSILALACALALGVFSATAGAQSRDITDQALLVDTRGATVMSAYGLCWHSQFGPPAAPNVTCGPQPIAQYVAPAPAPYVAPYVAPAPVVLAPVVMTPAAPLVVYEKVAFDANVLFDSDKSALRAAGRDTLDQFVGKIHGLDARSIMLIGYADRMGSHASNQVLSEERVDTVKSYLVGKGVAADRIQTSARGETQPTTLRADCKDANNVTNVACMQPDRHVFIEISGSRIAK
jgi:OOP family OmpA-OmpF porin